MVMDIVSINRPRQKKCADRFDISNHLRTVRSSKAIYAATTVTLAVGVV